MDHIPLCCLHHFDLAVGRFVQGRCTTQYRCVDVSVRLEIPCCTVAQTRTPGLGDRSRGGHPAGRPRSQCEVWRILVQGMANSRRLLLARQPLPSAPNSRSTFRMIDTSSSTSLLAFSWPQARRPRATSVTSAREGGPGTFETIGADGGADLMPSSLHTSASAAAAAFFDSWGGSFSVSAKQGEWGHRHN